jgi:argininosuccinate lyase
VQMMTLAIEGMQVNKERCEAAMSKELYATENAYKLVAKGVPFRDAYKQVKEELK